MTTRVRRKRVEDGTTTVPKVEASTIKVFRSYKASGALQSEDEAVEDLSVRKFEVEPAYVSVNHGRTTNIGNYESARVDVRVSVPCYKEEVKEAITYADITASTSLDEILKDYIQEIT